MVGDALSGAPVPQGAAANLLSRDLIDQDNGSFLITQ
jgi:hypothetical protein